MSNNVFKAVTVDSCALLVEVNASVWSGRKLDRAVSDEIVQSKGAKSKGAARVTKNLLADRPELEAIAKHVGAARTYVYSHTLPWSDSGLRLLPTVEFVKFNDRMGQFEEEFDKMVSAFIDVYPTLITAQAMALGDMFSRDEYPTPQSMRRRFAFNVSYMPVPSAGDFRVDVGNEAQRELRERLDKLSEERLQRAVGDIKARLGEHLKRMSDRLTVDIEEDGTEKPRRFHASLIDTAHDLCELVRSLNVTMDTGLEAARAGLEDAVKGMTAEDLRASPASRTFVKSRVDNVLQSFAWTADDDE